MANEQRHPARAEGDATAPTKLEYSNSESEHELIKAGKYITVLWLVGSVVFVTLRGWDVLLGFSPYEHRRMAMNELGDFLAGVFAPLAFAWLVLGFYLQRIELRLQREELRATRNETAALVAATANLSEATQQMASIEEARDKRATEEKRWRARLIINPVPHLFVDPQTKLHAVEFAVTIISSYHVRVGDVTGFAEPDGTLRQAGSQFLWVSGERVHLRFDRDVADGEPSTPFEWVEVRFLYVDENGDIQGLAFGLKNGAIWLQDADAPSDSWLERR